MASAAGLASKSDGAQREQLLQEPTGEQNLPSWKRLLHHDHPSWHTAAAGASQPKQHQQRKSCSSQVSWWHAASCISGLNTKHVM
jgi:hypothetical protein